MGGASPLLPETAGPGAALWKPRSRPGAGASRRAASSPCATGSRSRRRRPREVAAFAPDEIVLLPLYPQYSTTTTASSLKDWQAVYEGPGRSRAVCCYPTARGLVEAHADGDPRTWETAGKPREPAPAVLRPRPAAEDRRRRRPLSGADRGHRGGDRRAAAGTRRLAGLLPEPGRAAEVAGARPRTTRSAGPAPRARAC